MVDAQDEGRPMNCMQRGSCRSVVFHNDVLVPDGQMPW